MNYVIGAEGAKTVQEAYRAHHNTCPMCKGNSEPNGRMYDGRQQRECVSCHYPFMPIDEIKNRP